MRTENTEMECEVTNETVLSKIVTKNANEISVANS